MEPQSTAAPVNENASADSEAGATPLAMDRRKRNIPVAIDRRRQNAAEKRRTSERRRLIDPTTCERDYTDEETSFMKAMERYKRENRRPFPTWSEVLEVLRALGYRKVEAETELPGTKTDMERRQREIPAAEDRRKDAETPPKG